VHNPPVMSSGPEMKCPRSYLVVLQSLGYYHYRPGFAGSTTHKISHLVSITISLDSGNTALLPLVVHPVAMDISADATIGSLFCH